jgi:hypothetical protein
MKGICILLLTCVPVLLPAEAQKETPAAQKEYDIEYREYHFDRAYRDYYRVIASFKFADIGGLSRTSRQLVRDLIYDGLGFRNYAETIMANNGTNWVDRREYEFSLDMTNANQQFERLNRDRLPPGAVQPAFEFEIFFSMYDVTFISNEFVIFKQDGLSRKSDAARGNSWTYYRVIDFKNRRIMKLDHVLARGTLGALENRIREILHAQGLTPERYFRPGALPEPDSFSFEKRGLVLVWEPHSVSGFSDGIISAAIPYAELDRNLTGDGQRLMQNVTGAQ